MRPPDTSAPRCPDCGSLHYPATLSSGARVWCGGSFYDRTTEPYRSARARARLCRIEHAERMRADVPPIDQTDIGRIPDALPPEF